MLHPTPTQPTSTPTPFWHRLNTFFAFPFQTTPLLYALALALCSLLFEAVFFLPDLAAIAVIEGCILLAATRYGFKVTALGSRGISRAADFPQRLDADWTYLPWKLFAITLVQAFVAGWLARLNPLLGTLALFVLSFIFPATVIVLVQTCSFFETLNPAALWETMRTIGWPYALVCLFLFLLSSGAEMAIGLAWPLFDGLVLLPIVNFALIYFGWVTASLLGYVMYQHHVALGIELLPGGGADDGLAERRTPEQVAQQEVDATVAQLVTDGDMAGALALAYETQRTRPDELAAQRRYHRVLLLPDKTPALVDHGRRFIDLLLRRDLGAEALRVYKACREKDDGFVLDDALTALALAKVEWRAGEAHGALALLTGFDKRFRGHPAIPQAYELAARVLVQGLGRADMARPILAALESRYPESLETQEVRWLLRDVPAAA